MVVVEDENEAQKLDAGLLFSTALGFGQAVGGKGSCGVDKLESFSIGYRKNLSGEDLAELYRRANPIANLVDLLPDGANQRWMYLSSKVHDEKTLEAAQNFIDGAREEIISTWKKARLYGWAALVMLADDGVLDYSRPLNPAKIKTWRGWRSIAGGAATDISVRDYDENPMSVDYGLPSQFYLRGLEGQTVHRSRLVLMYGIKELRNIRNNYELGTSIVERAYIAFRNYDAGINTIANSLLDWSVDVLAIEDLTRLMANSKEFANVIAAMTAAKNQLKVMLLEAGKSEYKQVQRSYQGVKDVIELLQVALASSADIPIQMLFNVSPSGATSGSWEKDYWAQLVANRQKLELQPLLKQVLDMWFISQRLEPKYEINFPSILEMNDLEKSEEKYRNAQSQYNLSAALKLLVEAFILAPDEAALVVGENKNLAQALKDSLGKVTMQQKELQGQGASEKWQGRQLA